MLVLLLLAPVTLTAGFSSLSSRSSVQPLHRIDMMNRIMQVSLNVNDLAQTKEFYTSTFPSLHVEEHASSMILRFSEKKMGIEFIASEPSEASPIHGNVTDRCISISFTFDLYFSYRHSMALELQ